MSLLTELLLQSLTSSFPPHPHPHKWEYHIAKGGEGFPGGSDNKQSAHNTGDLGLIPGLGRSPGEENGNSLQYSCLENSMDGRSLVSYHPWGHKTVRHN